MNISHTHTHTHIRGLLCSYGHFSSPSLHPSLLQQSLSARSPASIASFISSLQLRLARPPLRLSCFTHFNTSLAHLVSSVKLVCPNYINCRFCTSPVMSFCMSIISLIVSFRILSNLVLLLLLPFL
jgi:hypothetical protein